jgi:6,7-dimethyl-8-ribityllumazine synthase
VKVALCVARFYTDLAERLESSARKTLLEGGATEIVTLDVPGAFELPLAARFAADAGYDAVVCLGAVIRGETSHYDYVCGEAARGIMQVQLDTKVPCGFGVLTVENNDQALARSGGGKRDSGEHAAEAVLALIRAHKQLSAS